MSEKQKKLLSVLTSFLETNEISYNLGGNTLGERNLCLECNKCLAEKKPPPAKRVASCPICEKCSLDCSHFVQMVFERSGFKAPYLTTSEMISLPAATLKERFQFIDLGTDLRRAQPGDLLVYHGHVAFLEKNTAPGHGDIVHVTSGRDLKDPGTAIQRERFASLASFRGTLLRILRHKEFYKLPSKKIER